MRDPERIERILREVYLIWRSQPDLRLMQLLMNVAADAIPPAGDRVGFAPSYRYVQVEDHALARELEQWRKKAETSAIDQLGAMQRFEDVIIRHDI